jgi:hypothetical protein
MPDIDAELAVALDVLLDTGSPEEQSWAVAVAEACGVLPWRRFSLRDRALGDSTSGYDQGQLRRSLSAHATWTTNYSTAGSWSARRRGRHSHSLSGRLHRDRSESGHAQQLNALGYSTGDSGDDEEVQW